MADDSPKAPVTDSRFAGFNPEVEASKALAAEAAEEAAAKARGEAPIAPPAPSYTHRCGMCGALYEKALELCAACGSASDIHTLAPKE